MNKLSQLSTSVEIELPEPHYTQYEVLENSKRFNTLLCGRRWGKSLICSSIAIEDILEQRRVAYITPTYQLASVFFDEIIKLSKGIFRTNRTELTIKIGIGELRFFTGENIDAMRGHKFHTVIIDEASYIKNLKDGWERVIRATLTDYAGRAFFVSTPRGYDYFYSLSLNTTPDWQSFKFTTYDNPYIPKEEIEEAKVMLPLAVFEQEYMANPMQNADNPFGSDAIRSCISELSTLEPKYYGIDLAKSYDYTVIIGLDSEGRVSFFKRFQRDWLQTKNEIFSLPLKTMGFMDSTGVGDPIAEEISRKMYGIEGFKFTALSKQQLIEGLVSAITQGLIKFPEGAITDELDTFEYKFTSTGVRYSARDGFHDDCVVALALAWKSYVEHKRYNKIHIR